MMIYFVPMTTHTPPKPQAPQASFQASQGNLKSLSAPHPQASNSAAVPRVRNTEVPYGLIPLKSFPDDAPRYSTRTTPVLKWNPPQKCT